MVEASAVEPGPPSNGLRGTVAATAAIVAAPFTNFLLLNLDFSVFEVFGSVLLLSMCLLPYLFEQLRWASASDLIARIENPKRRGHRQKQMHSYWADEEARIRTTIQCSSEIENSDVNSEGRIGLGNQSCY